MLSRIYRDGTVRYAARKSFDLSCHFDYFKVDHPFNPPPQCLGTKLPCNAHLELCLYPLSLQYPFDTHTCNVTIHSFAYTTSDYTLKVLIIKLSTISK